MLLLVRLISYFGYRENANRNCLKAEPGSVHVYNQRAESSLSWEEIFPEGADSNILGVSSLDNMLMILATSNLDFRQRLYASCLDRICHRGHFSSSGTAKNWCVISHLLSLDMQVRLSLVIQGGDVSQWKQMKQSLAFPAGFTASEVSAAVELLQPPWALPAARHSGNGMCWSAGRVIFPLPAISRVWERGGER